MDAQWLKIQFDLNPHKNRDTLAQILNVPLKTIDDILCGIRDIQSHEYKAMRRFFDLTVDGENAVRGLQKHTAAPINYDTLNTTGLYDSAAHITPDDTTKDWIIPDAIIPKDTAQSFENTTIIHVHETTMEPDFIKDEHVLVDTKNTTPNPPGVYVIYDGHTHLLRHCALLKNDKIRLTAPHKLFQPQTIHIDDIDIIGCVVAKIAWL